MQINKRIPQWTDQMAQKKKRIWNYQKHRRSQKMEKQDHQHFPAWYIMNLTNKFCSKISMSDDLWVISNMISWLPMPVRKIFLILFTHRTLVKPIHSTDLHVLSQTEVSFVVKHGLPHTAGRILHFQKWWRSWKQTPRGTGYGLWMVSLLLKQI